MFKSKIVGRSFLVLPENRDIPEKLNRKATNTLLKELKHKVASLQDILLRIYEEEPELYRLLEEEVFPDSLSVEDGRSFWLDMLYMEAVRMYRKLNTDDDVIPNAQDMVSMETLGFREDAFDRYEKILEDTEEREVAEEVYMSKDKLRRRLRTVLWDKTAYGRSSREIRYQSLRITKTLEKAYAVSIAEKKLRENKEIN